MATKTITITLTETTVNDLKELGLHMRDNPSLEQIALKALEQGITQLAYRYQRNAKKWIEAKEEKNELIQLRALAAQMGKGEEK